MLIPLAELPRRLGPGQRLIGLDFGAKLIGVALSDVSLTVASPLATIRRGKLGANAAEVMALAARHGVGGLVVGLPLSMDGSLGPAAQAARDWTRALAEVTGLPASLFDERLSSAAVNRMMIEADLTRARRAATVDRAAAAYILQAALDVARAMGENDAALGNQGDPPP